MTNSTVTLCIQELAEAKGLTLEEISQVLGISQQLIQLYATTPVEITEEIAADLRKIATHLNIPVVELVKPVAKREAFKLKILEKIQQAGLTLEELSQQSGVHLATLTFYSTQPICQQKLAEPQCQISLNKISALLGCCVEDLQASAELPTTRLQVEESLKEKGLTLENLSLLTNLPIEFIDLMATQPLSMNSENARAITFTESIEPTEPRDIACQLCKVSLIRYIC